MKKTAFERWREKVDMKGPDDCWEWLGFKERGYGQIRINKKKYTHTQVFLRSLQKQWSTYTK